MTLDMRLLQRVADWLAVAVVVSLADVDHGSDTTTATASQPAARCNVRISSVMA